MIERRLVGRRFIDFHPEAAHPLYPGELERRVVKRRNHDRDGTPGGLDALLSSRRRRPPILWSGFVRCQSCSTELGRARNLSSEARKHFLAEHVCAPARCQCAGEPAHIEWVLQAGFESARRNTED